MAKATSDDADQSPITRRMEADSGGTCSVVNRAYEGNENFSDTAFCGASFGAARSRAARTEEPVGWSEILTNFREESLRTFRSRVERTANGVWLISRNGRDHTARLPEIAGVVAELPARALILDGELCALDAQLISHI